MFKSFSFPRTLALLGATGAVFSLMGCSQEPKPSSASEVQAFQGNPAVKAAQGAARRDALMKQAQSGSAAAQAAAAQAAAKADSGPPKK